jgi:hypothetical protein
MLLTKFLGNNNLDHVPLDVPDENQRKVQQDLISI